MTQELKEAKREAKALGIDTKFKVSKTSWGEYDVYYGATCLASGYNITECRVAAINELIENKKNEIYRKEEAEKIYKIITKAKNDIKATQNKEEIERLERIIKNQEEELDCLFY